MPPGLSNRDLPVCMTCNQTDKIYYLQVPRVFRYLTSELSSVGIKVMCDIGNPKDRKM
jgi:DNA-directed RNA polymerase beta subunit